MIRTPRYVWVLLILISAVHQLTAADSLAVENGKKLFTQNCKACHMVDRRMVGPALKGVETRHSEDWIFSFVKSSQAMVEQGDSAAVALFNTYNQVIMPNHTLQNEQIRDILTYIAEASAGGAGGEGGIVRPVVASANAGLRPPKFSDFRFWILYTITVLLVIVSIYYKAELIALRKQVQPESDGAGA